MGNVSILTNEKKKIKENMFQSIQSISAIKNVSPIVEIVKMANVLHQMCVNVPINGI